MQRTMNVVRRFLVVLALAASLLPMPARAAAVNNPVRCVVVVPVRSSCAYVANDFYAGFVSTRYGGWAITVQGPDGYEFGSSSPFSGTISMLPGDLVSVKTFNACPLPAEPVSMCSSGTVTIAEGVIIPFPPTL
ncbi:MAG: hypothetical protein ACYDCC_15665 [Actinomycetota bacterium]